MISSDDLTRALVARALVAQALAARAIAARALVPRGGRRLAAAAGAVPRRVFGGVRRLARRRARDSVVDDRRPGVHGRGHGHAGDQGRARRRLRQVPDVRVAGHRDRGPSGRSRRVVVGPRILFQREQRVRVRRRAGLPVPLARLQLDDGLVQRVQALLVDVRRGGRRRDRVLGHGRGPERQAALADVAAAPAGLGLRQHQRHRVDGLGGRPATAAPVTRDGGRLVDAVRPGRVFGHRVAGGPGGLGRVARARRRREERAAALAERLRVLVRAGGAARRVRRRGRQVVVHPGDRGRRHLRTRRSCYVILVGTDYRCGVHSGTNIDGLLTRFNFFNRLRRHFIDLISVSIACKLE